MPSRRHFLSITAGAVSLTALPLSSLWSAQAMAAGGPPRVPPAPQDPGSGSTSPEKLPDINAPSEGSGAGDFEPLPPDQRVGYAIVGLGHLSLQEILPAFAASRLSKPVALVSGHRQKAERVARAYGIPSSSIYSYDDYERMKTNKEIQVVYIVLPNSMHKEFTVRAAAIGKHVLCEKPMSVSSADAQSMIEACHKADRKLMIAYRQQYEPNNRRMQEILRTKAFGQVKIFEAVNVQNNAGRSGGAQQWRHIKALAGGGALPDIGLYCLSAARFYRARSPMKSPPSLTRQLETHASLKWRNR